MSRKQEDNAEHDARLILADRFAATAISKAQETVAYYEGKGLLLNAAPPLNLRAARWLLDNAALNLRRKLIAVARPLTAATCWKSRSRTPAVAHTWCSKPNGGRLMILMNYG